MAKRKKGERWKKIVKWFNRAFILGFIIPGEVVNFWEEVANTATEFTSAMSQLGSELSNLGLRISQECPRIDWKQVDRDLASSANQFLKDIESNPALKFAKDVTTAYVNQDVGYVPATQYQQMREIRTLEIFRNYNYLQPFAVFGDLMQWATNNLFETKTMWGVEYKIPKPGVVSYKNQPNLLTTYSRKANYIKAQKIKQGGGLFRAVLKAIVGPGIGMTPGMGNPIDADWWSMYPYAVGDIGKSLTQGTGATVLAAGYYGLGPIGNFLPIVGALGYV